ncbi:uncharacterized protein LOC132262445 [Phlebotomus argentipes]|uniref:uncharacterized protein LOC132262445 n=1 Tax=Phlebotomus argentipes TaxID=94469 RepID=UPI002892EF0D|nr:uncharacterized protein LOC132262445 [Phlebotomus argentipes]
MTSRVYQYLATISGNIAAIAFGTVVGWVSPVIPVLLTPDSSLPSGPISDDQASWINSSTCLGGIIGNVIFGALVDRIGRKWSLFLLSLPLATSFLLILFAQDGNYLLASRIVGGIAGGGLFIALPIYINEISEDKVRGRLGAALIVLDNTGILVGYVIGSYMTISTFPYVVLALVAIFATTFLFFPETPYYLLLKNRPAEAEKSLKFFRGVKDDAKSDTLTSIQTEFENMKNLINSASKKDSVTIQDLIAPTTIRAVLISLVLLLGTDFCGVFAIVTYTTSIFQEAGSDLSPNLSAIVVAAIQVVGSLISSWLVDRAGRRVLLIVSATGTALCHTALGAHLFLKASGVDMSAYGWLPLSALSGAVFICNIGINNLPFFIFAEFLPPKILGFLATAFLFISWTAAFLVILYYTYIVEAFGMYTCYWFFAGFCFFEALFVLFLVPETKGKSFEAIQEALAGKRRKPTPSPTVYTISFAVKIELWGARKMKLINFSSINHQFVAVFCVMPLPKPLVNIISLAHGSTVGWLSPFLPILLSEESPLITGQISIDEASWIGALLCVGGIIGCAVYGSLATRCGRKTTILLLAVPHIGFWLCVIFADYVYHLYLARFFAGATGGGLYIVVPLFVAEIADPSIRGRLGAILPLAVSMGIFNGYVAGTFIHHSYIPFLMLSLSAFFLLSVISLPETPLSLLKANRVADAEASFKFYKNASGITDTKMKEDFERVREQQMKSQSREEKLQLSDFTTPAAKKGFVIGIGLMLLTQFCGCFAFVNYTATIFKESGSELDPNISSIVLGMVQIFGTYTSTIFVDRAGRKTLLMISSIGAATGLILMGSYSFFKFQGYALAFLDWVPVVTLSLVIYISSVGILALPYIVLAEVLPSKIRAVGSSFCLVTISISAFVILKAMPILMTTIQLFGCLWLFAAFCIVGAIFIALVVPETKGKVLDDDVQANDKELQPTV